MDWSIHIQFIVKKISSNLWLLSKLKEYLSLEHRVQSYKTYIQPHIDYCSTVWGGTSHSNLDRIYRLQKRAVKIILDYEYNNDIACSMDELKILNIYERVFLRQVAQRATIAHLSPMCQGQISFQKHINGPWKPEARNQTHPSFYACPGYQQLWWRLDQKWMS